MDKLLLTAVEAIDRTNLDACIHAGRQEAAGDDIQKVASDA